MDSIRDLIYLHLLGKCTKEQESILAQWAEKHPAYRAMLDRLSDSDYTARQLMKRAVVNSSRPMDDMRRRIAETESSRGHISRLSIAASITALLAFSAITWIYLTKGSLNLNDTLTESIADTKVCEVRSLDEINPGSTKARLIIGSKSIDLHPEDTTRINPAQITRNSTARERETTRLCLDVPRGGEFKITLEDSTVVWLNSQSRLYYPESFGNKDRRVRIKGEAYFAVHHDDQRPFYVETEGHTVRVYGTRFNVRAYEDDPCVYTTLEQGSISISSQGGNSGEVLLSPGHQALIDHTGENLKVRRVDPTAITAWRHGRFVFEEQPLSSIMRDLSRWYDISFRFTDPTLEGIVFMGSIPRYADLATALALIEKSGGLNFTIEDGEVVISRK